MKKNVNWRINVFMGYAIKHSIFAIGLISSIATFGQVVRKTDAPSNLKDTVYIGITNKVKLDGKTVNPISVQSSDARVLITGNELTIQPVKPGDLTVKIIYDDTTISRKFISTYLPKPTK